MVANWASTKRHGRTSVMVVTFDLVSLDRLKWAGNPGRLCFIGGAFEAHLDFSVSLLHLIWKHHDHSLLTKTRTESQDLALHKAMTSTLMTNMRVLDYFEMHTISLWVSGVVFYDLPNSPGKSFSHAFRMSSKSSSRSSSATCCFEWTQYPIVSVWHFCKCVQSWVITNQRMENAEFQWTNQVKFAPTSGETQFPRCNCLGPNQSLASSSKRSAKCEKQAPANCGDLTLVDALDISQNFRSETRLTFPLEWSNSTIYDSMAKPRLCLATKSKSIFTRPAATYSFSWKQKALGATSSNHMHSFSWDANDDDQQLRLKHGTRTSFAKADGLNGWTMTNPLIPTSTNICRLIAVVWTLYFIETRSTLYAIHGIWIHMKYESTYLWINHHE